MDVTTRTLQGRFLLRPTPEVVNATLGVLGRALERFSEIRLFGFVALSNHIHLLLFTPDARTLAAFMEYVNGNVARVVGKLNGWTGKFWERRYAAIPVLGDDCVVARFRYLFANSCKEGLVASPLDWPGASSARALALGETLAGAWPGSNRQFFVRCHPIPPWAGLSEGEYRARCLAIARDIERETRAQHLRDKTTPLGQRRIVARSPYARASSPELSPAPLCHALTKKLRHGFRERYRSFVRAFRLAAESLRNGVTDASFPIGSFPPPMPFVATRPLPPSLALSFG